MTEFVHSRLSGVITRLAAALALLLVVVPTAFYAWFDSVVVRHATRVNGLSSLAVTKLDVLDGCKELKVCTVGWILAWLKNV